jgi:hypothetical protein
VQVITLNQLLSIGRSEEEYETGLINQVSGLSLALDSHEKAVETQLSSFIKSKAFDFFGETYGVLPL